MIPALAHLRRRAAGINIVGLDDEDRLSSVWVGCRRYCECEKDDGIREQDGCYKSSSAHRSAPDDGMFLFGTDYAAFPAAVINTKTGASRGLNLNVLNCPSSGNPSCRRGLISRRLRTVGMVTTP
ncbi:MAG: hypothetical protein GXP27_05900 [Planctomycetes bacterium]|nr:hypothetical protein [Planctomycetota bacterium]